MKRQILILTLAILMALFVSNAGANQLIYTEVVIVPNATKEALFQRANVWTVSAFNDAKTAIQISDKESGKIIGKSAFIYKQSFIMMCKATEGPISFVFKILVKDGKYKYEFSEFTHTGATKTFGLITDDRDYPFKVSFWDAPFWYNDVWHDIKAQISVQINYGLISSLKEAMTKSDNDASDNW